MSHFSMHSASIRASMSSLNYAGWWVREPPTVRVGTVCDAAARAYLAGYAVRARRHARGNDSNERGDDKVAASLWSAAFLTRARSMFVCALREGSLVATAVNSGVNFICTVRRVAVDCTSVRCKRSLRQAILALLIFGEAISLAWCAGATVILVGVALLSTCSPAPEAPKL